MRFLVTGAGGMLAQAVVPLAAAREHEVVGLTRRELDVQDQDAVATVITDFRPHVVVQCAAFTDVDGAESDEAAAFGVNAGGAAVVAAACHRTGALFVYPSTDYVFPGNASEPYSPDTPIAPLNAYGRSKAAGELASRKAVRQLVIRTSWLYGGGGRNFVETISRLARERPRLQVVDDQTGRPTWTRTLADAIVRLAERGATGVLHWSDGGEPVTWHGLAAEALRLQGITIEVEPVPSEMFARPAPRPRYSVLDCRDAEALLGRGPIDWRSSLRSYLEDEGLIPE